MTIKFFEGVDSGFNMGNRETFALGVTRLATQLNLDAADVADSMLTMLIGIFMSNDLGKEVLVKRIDYAWLQCESMMAVMKQGIDRSCTVCMGQGIARPAAYVATGETAPDERVKPFGLGPLEWFECGNHKPQEHGMVFGGDTRKRTLVPLEQWLKKNGVTS